MKLWRNVLVHVDGRRDTPEPLETSVRVAELFGGRVIAFDSIETSTPVLSTSFPPLAMDPSLEFVTAVRADQLRDGLAAVERRVPAEALVGTGATGGALLDCAAREETDLIVKATSAADVREMTVSGMAALHLLRASEVPVWLYAPQARRSGRVVAVVNLSGTGPEQNKLNENVVRAAARLSLLEPAELHVVCVADHARDRLYESILRSAQYSRYLVKDRADLWRSLTDLTTRLAPRSVPHLVEGDPLEALERIVLELEADAVTLGRDDTEAFDGMLGVYGAERLFCRIDRSVLLVTPESTRSRTHPRSAVHHAGSSALTA